MIRSFSLTAAAFLAACSVTGGETGMRRNGALAETIVPVPYDALAECLQVRLDGKSWGYAGVVMTPESAIIPEQGRAKLWFRIDRASYGYLIDISKIGDGTSLVRAHGDRIGFMYTAQETADELAAEADRCGQSQ